VTNPNQSRYESCITAITHRVSGSIYKNLKLKEEEKRNNGSVEG